MPTMQAWRDMLLLNKQFSSFPQSWLWLRQTSNEGVVGVTTLMGLNPMARPCQVAWPKSWLYTCLEETRPSKLLLEAWRKKLFSQELSHMHVFVRTVHSSRLLIFCQSLVQQDEKMDSKRRRKEWNMQGLEKLQMNVNVLSSSGEMVAARKTKKKHSQRGSQSLRNLFWTLKLSSRKEKGFSLVKALTRQKLKAFPLGSVEAQPSVVFHMFIHRENNCAVLELGEGRRGCQRSLHVFRFRYFQCAG